MFAKIELINIFNFSENDNETHFTTKDQPTFHFMMGWKNPESPF